MTNGKNLDKLALFVGLGGLLLAVLVGVIGRLVERDLRGPAFLLFAGTQVAAIALGLMSRHTVMGKAAAIISSILLVGSLATVA